MQCLGKAAYNGKTSILIVTVVVIKHTVVSAVNWEPLHIGSGTPKYNVAV